MMKTKKIATTEALEFAGNVFDFNKRFPEYILKEKYPYILFLSCRNGIWNSLNYFWEIFNEEKDLFTDSALYLTSPDIIRFGKKPQLENNSYQLSLPIAFSEMVGAIKRNGHIYDQFYLEMILFNLKKELVIYAHEDFSIFFITTVNSKIKSKILDKIKKDSIINNIYLGDNINDFKISIVNNLGFSNEDVNKFHNWFSE